MTVVSSAFVGSGAASGAVAGSKTKVTVKDCTTATCQITWTIKGVVKVMPTGTVSYFLGPSTIAATGGGACAAYPLVPLKAATASAVCSATGLSRGYNKISVSYSGDHYFDPSITTKTIKVAATPSG